MSRADRTARNAYMRAYKARKAGRIVPETRHENPDRCVGRPDDIKADWVPLCQAMGLPLPRPQEVVR